MQGLSLENIKGLGLQQNEAAIYLALLELGQGTVTQISHKAGLNRTTGYDVLERLCFYGLSGRVAKGKAKIYTAESPSHLHQYLENRKQITERRLEEFKNLLPDLQSLYRTELKPMVKFAEGREAMEKLYYDVLESKGEVYAILNLKNYSEVFNEMGVYQAKERKKRGIREKVLAINNDTAQWWYKKTYDKNPGLKKITEYRWLPDDEKFSTAGEINIFDNKVIVLLSRPGENMAFEIQSQTFADFLKIIFERAWKE